MKIFTLAGCLGLVTSLAPSLGFFPTAIDTWFSQKPEWYSALIKMCRQDSEGFFLMEVKGRERSLCKPSAVMWDLLTSENRLKLRVKFEFCASWCA